MALWRTQADVEIPEKTGYRYEAMLTKIVAGGSSPLLPADLATLTLTLYALDSALTIINGINAVNILNTGRGTLDGTGKLVVILGLADLVILDTTQTVERRIMLIQGVDVSGNQATRHEVLLKIRNLAKVT